jgi:hypothetical protein
MENTVDRSSDRTVTCNIQESQLGEKYTLDGGMLPFNLCKKPGTAFSKMLSPTNAGSLQSGKENTVVMKEGTKNEIAFVDGVARGDISVLRNEKETVARGSEGDLKKKCSDDDIVVIRHLSMPQEISLSAAERIKNKAKESHLEWNKNQCVIVAPNISASNDTTAKSAMGQHSRNNTGISRSICQSTVISNSTTTVSPEDVKIVTKSEISKPGKIQKVLQSTLKAVTNGEMVLEDPSMSEKNRWEDIQLISGKSSADISAAIGKNKMSQATTSSKRNKSSLSSVNYSRHNAESTENKNTDTYTIACKNAVPSTAVSDVVAELPYEPPKIPAEIQSMKNVALSRTLSDITTAPVLPSGRKLSLSKSYSSRKKNADGGIIPSRAGLNSERQFILSSEHSVVSPSKQCAGRTDTSKDDRVITVSENSSSQCIISCLLSHLKQKHVRPALDENLSFKQRNISDCKLSAVLQKKPWLTTKQSKQGSNDPSSVSITLKPAVSMSQEKRRSPTHVLNVADTSLTLMAAKDSVTLASTMCNTVLVHKEASTVKGPIAECESINSKCCIPLHLREKSVKSSEVPSVSSSGKQTTVLHHDSSLKRRKATKNKALPQSGTEVESAANKLHEYIALLYSDVKIKKNELFSHSSDKEIETNLTSTVSNVSVHSPNVISEFRRGTSSISDTCEGRMPVAHDQSVHDSLLYPDVRSEGKEACSSPEVKQNKILECFSRNGTVFSSGSSVACVGSTSATHKQTSKIICCTPGKDVMEPATTISESETTKNFKLSQEISRHPSKFSLIKHNSFEILMAGQKTPQKRSPSKRLSKSSPIKYMINNRSPRNMRYRTTSPSKANVNKRLKFDSCNAEGKSGSFPLTEPNSQSSLSEFSFSSECVSYFEAMIAEVLKDRDMLPVISEEELKIVTNFWNLETQVKKLYVRMLSRKYSWHRVSDIKYDDIDVPGAFIELEMSGLVTSGMYNFAEHNGCTVFAHLNAGVVRIPHHAWRFVCVYSVSIVLCVGRGLVTG